MIPSSTIRTASPCLLLLAATSLLLAACTSAPQAAPSPTPLFSSKDDAFAAAEATYRAYNDAGNDRRNGDLSAKPQRFLRGEALEAELAAEDYLRSKGLQLVGDVSVTDFIGLDADVKPARTLLTALVCLDVSRARLVSVEGTDVTSTERPPVLAQTVQMSADVGDLLIDHEEEAAADQCSEQ